MINKVQDTSCCEIKAKGISLLEILLALAVMAVILIASISRYQQYQFEANESQVKKSVAILQQGLTEYFYRYCAPLKDVDKYFPFGTDTEPKSVDDLYAEIGWDKKDKVVRNPLGEPFTVVITKQPETEQPRSVISTLFVRAKFNGSPEVVKIYSHLFNASCHDEQCSDGILIWRKLPQYSSPDIDSNLWIMKAGLQQFRNVNKSDDPDKKDMQGICANFDIETAR